MQPESEITNKMHDYDMQENQNEERQGVSIGSQSHSDNHSNGDNDNLEHFNHIDDDLAVMDENNFDHIHNDQSKSEEIQS